MNAVLKTAAILLAWTGAVGARAQEAPKTQDVPKTLGEVLDLGAKPFTKEHFLPLLPLTRTYRWNDGNGQTVQTFKADGTLKGTATVYAGGGSSPSYGYWKFKDNGQWCVDERFTAWNRGYEHCVFLYQVGGAAVYASSSDSDRNGPVTRVTLTP